MRGNDLSDRMLEFSVRVLKVAEALPATIAGRHICTQLVRSATSAGANYEESRAGESRADFVHKLGVSLKEFREAYYWLRLIGHAGMLPPERMDGIVQESDELCRIVGRSIVTLKKPNQAH